MREIPKSEQIYSERELIERKREILNEIMKKGSIGVIDCTVVAGDASRSFDRKRKEKKSFEEKSGPFAYMYDKDWSREDSKRWINEGVSLTKLKVARYEQKPVYEKRWYGKKLTGHRWEQVGEEEKRCKDVIVGGSDEMAYSLQYAFRAKDLESFFPKARGYRVANALMWAEIYLPESLARRAYEMVNIEPEFIRDIVSEMTDKKSSFVKEFKDTEAWRAWLEQKKDSTQMYINPAETLDTDFIKDHVVEVK